MRFDWSLPLKLRPSARHGDRGGEHLAVNRARVHIGRSSSTWLFREMYAMQAPNAWKIRSSRQISEELPSSKVNLPEHDGWEPSRIYPHHNTYEACRPLTLAILEPPTVLLYGSLSETVGSLAGLPCNSTHIKYTTL